MAFSIELELEDGGHVTYDNVVAYVVENEEEVSEGEVAEEVVEEVVVEEEMIGEEVDEEIEENSEPDMSEVKNPMVESEEEESK